MAFRPRLFALCLAAPCRAVRVSAPSRSVYVSCTRGASADDGEDGGADPAHSAIVAFDRLSQKLKREGLAEMLKKREVRRWTPVA